ncbi:hypothetical protein, partial [Phaeobacter sp. HF9A]|uniref:hypothetical protein n=1 Tax=Phaeobacter sp. HF9A TaxID=2721561 RepID=UPI001C37DA05
HHKIEIGKHRVAAEGQRNAGHLKKRNTCHDSRAKPAMLARQSQKRRPADMMAICEALPRAPGYF